MAKASLESDAVVTKQPCPDPECGSSDAFAFYTDGHGHCFAQGKHYSAAQLRKLGYEMALEVTGPDRHGSGPVDGRRVPAVDRRQDVPGLATLKDFLAGTKHLPLKSRGLTLATCKRWNYLVRKHPTKHTYQQLATMPDKNGHPVAIHVRDTGRDGTDKEFFWIGSQAKVVGLYGQHFWPSGGGNRPKSRLMICEGEIDTLTVSQSVEHKWPVVGVVNGAGNATKDIAASLEWINTFESVVFMFDMDDPGREAAKACAELLPPGNAYIASFTEKDPNKLLTEGKGQELIQAPWNAAPYRPDGMEDARVLTAKCLEPIIIGMPWPWKSLTRMTFGRRYGEVYTIGAGFGIGKTDALAAIIASTIAGQTSYGEKYERQAWAAFSYETEAHVLKNSIAGKLWSRRFHIPNIPGETQYWEPGELAEALKFMDDTLWATGGKLFINNSKGAGDWGSVMSRCRFYRHAENVRHFSIDPLSAMVVEGDEDDERKALDKIMREVAKLALELDACLYVGSHLTRPKQGDSHEEGGQVRGNQFRGSNGIGMFSDYVIGLERNTQADDPVEKTKTTWRMVKDRKTGISTGQTFDAFYDVVGGTLDEAVT